MKKTLLMLAFDFLAKKCLPKSLTFLFALLFINISNLLAQSGNYLNDCDELPVASNITCGNMLANPSFEFYTGTDELLWCKTLSNMNYVCRWGELANEYHDGTPNFIHVDLHDGIVPGCTNCYDFIDDNCDGSDLRPPLTNYANQGFNPSGIGATQNGYMGLFTMDQSTPGALGYREYVSQKLLTPILNGQTVQVSFYVSLGDISTLATNIDVGFYQTLPTLPTFYNLELTIPAAQVVSVTPIVTNRTGWVQVTANWTNSTGQTMNYMVLGNFKNNGATTTVVPPTSPTMLYALPGETNPVNNFINCYYLIDDVVLAPVVTNCCDVTKFVVNPLDPTVPINISDPSIAGYFSTGSTVFVDRPLVMNISTTFNNVTVNFGPNGYIIVNTNRTFFMHTNSILRGCNNMWRGIDATAFNARVIGHDSFIFDAQWAIMSKGGNLLQSYNMTYNNNYVGIYLKDYTNAWTNFAIRNSFFNSSAVILKPNTFGITNTKCEAGVLIENAGEIVMKPTGAANKNRFQNLNNGIKILNTSVEVSNVNFLNIRNYDANGSNAIYADNTVHTVLYYLYVNNTTGTAVVNGCDNGFFSQFEYQMNIHNVLFNNIEGTLTWPNPQSGYGIYATYNGPHVLAAFPQMNFSNNNFNRVKYGVTLLNCDVATANINNNNIFMPAGSGAYIPLSVGIQIINKGTDPNVKCDGPTCTISENTINRYEDAIRTNFAPCLLIESNTVNLLPPSYNQHRGIFLENSPQPIVGVNTVTGNAADWRNQGIRFFKSPATTAYCNTIDNTGYGFWLDEDCNFSYIHHNFLTNYLYGMYFVNAAKIGPQYTIGASNLACKNWWQKQNSADQEFVIDQVYSDVFLDLNSRFYFEAPDPNIKTNNSSMNVLTLSGPAVPNFRFSANTLGVPGPVAYCLPFMSQTPLVERIIKRFELGDLPFTAFGTTNETNSRWMFNQNVLYTANAYSDTLSSATLTLEMQNFLDSLQTTDVAQMMQVDHMIQTGDFAGASTLNSGISGVSGSVTLLQQVHNILIAKWDSIENEGTMIITQSEIDELISIAALCPAEYGDAVVKARVFLQFHINDTLRFMNECELPVELRNAPRFESFNPTENEDGDSKLVIYPNPADDYFVINTYSGLELDVKLMNQQGQMISQHKLKDGDSVNISEIAAGIYIVQVSDSNGNIYPATQLVITK